MISVTFGALMISYAEFRDLRLSQFLPDADITELNNWEFMDHLWVGEAVGFSEWLRLENEPEILRSIAIDFSDFPEQAASAVMRAIDVQARPGMKLDELRALLGDPTKKHHFVEDRVSYEFTALGPPRYDVSCTVLNKGGLTYLVVMVPLVTNSPRS